MARPQCDPMLTARFTAPAVPKTLVHRPELLERLTAGVQGPLTLINGPAGSGKTVLTAHWAAAGGRAPRPPVWLTVEPDDAPGVFWAYVLEALHRGGVELPAAVGAPTRAEGVTQSFLVRLAAGLAESGSARPVVLVLDQFDTAQPPAMTEGLDFVLRHAAGGLRIVLTSRTDSLLPLHRYRAAGEIAEIRHADLRFTHADAEALLAEHRLHLSQAGIRLLVERTEGWAAGVRLCALAMQRSPDPEAFVRQFAADRTTIADYLLTEVLDAQPPATQDLLLRVSVTDRVHPDLADALTGRDDGARTLAGLARDNAFLEQVDASAWYRLHPLFAEVLRAHLRRRHPGLEQQLHGRAARWLAGTGRLNEAVVQGAAAGDWPFAAGRLVDALAIGRLFTGLEAEQLNRAFAALPADAPGAAPALVGAAARLVVQDLPGYEEAVRRADSLLGPDSGAPARLSRAFLGVLAGRAARDPAATERAAADAERVLGELPAPPAAAHPELRALLLAALGAVRLGAGRLDAARSALTAAVDACAEPATEPGTEAGTRYPLCDALGSLALVELLRGRLGRAAEHARASLVVAEQAALPPGRRSGTGHLVLAGVAFERGDLPAARSHLDLSAATAAAGPRPEPAAAVQAAVVGARIAAAEGDAEAALTVLARLRPAGTAPQAGQPPAWAADALAVAESAVHLARGDAEAALRVLDAAPCGRPEHALARARALLAAGRTGPAARELAGLPADDGLPVPVRVGARLLGAEIAAADGRTGEAQRKLAEAVELARPEELRRPFADGGPWVRRNLRATSRPTPRPGRTADGRTGRTAQSGRTGPGGPGGPDAPPPVVEALSARETEVLRQAARMLSTEEIAAELYLSANTVKTHLKSIYRKLCVTRRSDAVHRAQDLGLL
ncbi:LuxR C-terminal-related transcriptional regulator [Streptomyces erythrochromogenes]|uniref:LuxR C-terminal-related transcriptional regulator n=1 Tax=Streptomyces erythrochromogenes TaxID=285574 RepID=UPI0033326DD6